MRICRCGDPENSHENNGAYFGPCLLCGCQLFDINLPKRNPGHSLKEIPQEIMPEVLK